MSFVCLSPPWFLPSLLSLYMHNFKWLSQLSTAFADLWLCIYRFWCFPLSILESVVCSPVSVFHAVSVILTLSLYSSRKRWDLDLSSSPYLVNPGWLSPSCSNQDHSLQSICSCICLSAVVVGGMLSGGSCDQWFCMSSVISGTIHWYICHCCNIIPLKSVFSFCVHHNHGR